MIKEASNIGPLKRPTFKEIINPMINNYIMFHGANDAEIRAFYDAESEKMNCSRLNIQFTLLN